jgi:hypothetical protein
MAGAAGEKEGEMDEELTKFKTEIDIRLYAASQGYQVSRKESWAGSAVMRHPNGDKIVVKRDSDSHWVYFSVKADSSGSIIDLVKHLHGYSIGAARKELRTFMGLPSPALPPYPPLVQVVKDRIRVERAYARMETALRHPYLENERGIPSEILANRRFAGRVRIDGRGNAVFPHFDADGLSGFEIKNQGFTGFSTGGTKGIWTSHIEPSDNRIAFCESAIDALSLAVLAPDTRTRYASISGRPSPAQMKLIRAAAAVMPAGSTVVAAMDADGSGRALAEMVREAVKLAGRADLCFEAKFPQGFKDWNDQLCARVKSRRHRSAQPTVA